MTPVLCVLSERLTDAFAGCVQGRPGLEPTDLRESRRESHGRKC